MATTVFDRPMQYSVATQSADGLMSSTDKTKLDGIETGAQVNPGTATQSAAGLMSSTDKTKLDGIATGATANTGTITGITMNGASKGTSGVVDLGTVITSHQDISGKVSGPASATNNAVAIFDGTGGKTIKNSGYTIGKSVPSDAVFTDTTALGNMTGTLGVSHGGTGKTSGKEAAIYFINSLDTANSDPVDADYYVAQYANGGASNTNYYRRPVSALFGYIKSKLGLNTSSGSTSKCLTEKGTWASFTNNAGTITGITMNGSSKGTSGTVDLGTVLTDSTAFTAYRGNLTSLGNSTPADATKTYWQDNVSAGRVEVAYNSSGGEYTILFSKGSAGYGNVIKYGYDDKYIKILRRVSGNWKSTDWEKIDAGYADSAGSVAWGNVSGRPTAVSSFTNDSGYITSSGSCAYANNAGNVSGGTISSANQILLLSNTNKVCALDQSGNNWIPMYASAFNVQSSKLVKENINEITEEEAEKILDVKAVSFDFIKGFGEKDRYGVIAEQVEEVIPFAVTTPKDYDENQFDPEKGLLQPIKSVDYSKFVPHLIRMVQILNDRLEKLEKKDIEEI